jgi:two-component system response regulator CpxR
MSILLVDDDVELCRLIEEYLTSHGFTVHCVHDGAAGLSRVFGHPYALVILDVMLPFLDGFEVLQQLRRRSNVPVILLTARTCQQDRIRGFDVGADDYLLKPFAAGELLARVRAVLRRARGEPLAPLAELRVGPILINPAARHAWNSGAEIDLTSMEFDLLELFVRSAGRVVSRDEIAAVIHQREALPFERSIDVHVSHLRKKLAPHGDQLLLTVRGVGYLFSLGE